jgi:RNA polymerase sigma factor (sigma-70 family)
MDASEEAPSSRPSSISALYRLQYEPMVRLAYLLVGTRAVAEDIVQDAFAQMHQKWSSVRIPNAYLRTSVVNGCRAHHRRVFRERAHFPELVTDSLSKESPMILDAVTRLPYRQRVALVLRFYEDLPDEEIAKALRCRPATVRSLVHRGLAALRDVIEP